MTEFAEKLAEIASTEKAREWIRVAIDDYLDGRPDLEAESLELAGKWEIDGDVIKRTWNNARKMRAAFAVPGTQPPLVEAPKIQPKLKSDKMIEAEEFLAKEASKEAARPKVALRYDDFGDPIEEGLAAKLDAAKAKPKPEEEEPPLEEPEPEPELSEPKVDRVPDHIIASLGNHKKPEEEPEPEIEWEGPVVLSVAAPMDNAKEFAERHCYQQGFLATYFWRDEFWRWNNKVYQKLEEVKLTGEIATFLDRAKKRSEEDGLVRFRPRGKDLEELKKFLKPCLALDMQVEPGRWLDSGENAEDWLAFRNCMVNVVTGETQGLTPKLWTHGVVDFDWNGKAECPRFTQLLEEWFPEDEESQMTVEEQLGYGMTWDNSFEKGAIWAGDRRSGKSTTSWLQQKLTGTSLCTSLNVVDWVANENSRANIIGKKVGIFPDMRLRPGKMYGTNYDPGGLDHKSASLMLQITGRDLVRVGRKYDPEGWEGIPRMKLIIISNEIPNLQDSTGVLPTRFIKLWFPVSFAGREDHELRNKLVWELPGIAARCLAAYRRLRERGGFIQPKAGSQLEQDILEAVDPVAAFIAECCIVKDGEKDKIGRVFERFKNWCRKTGRTNILYRIKLPHQFSVALRTVLGNRILTVREHGDPTKDIIGLRLKPVKEDILNRVY